MHIDLENVDVAMVLETSSSNMLLWLKLGARQLGTCYCCDCFGHIELENITVANVLGTSA